MLALNEHNRVRDGIEHNVNITFREENGIIKVIQPRGDSKICDSDD